MPSRTWPYSEKLNEVYPAPYVTVRIRNGPEVRVLPALLDTGSDITVVPELTVAALGLQQISDNLTLHDGSGGVTEDVPTYVADLEFDGFEVRRLEITT